MYTSAFVAPVHIVSRPPTRLRSISSSKAAELSMVVQKDVNGREIQVGQVVQVVAEGLKAFQVNPKGYGRFSEEKQFVPGDDGTTKNCLELPVGLQGVVTKVYNVEDISAQTPIQVKFEPGKHVVEYDPPVAFLMHFHTYELECVEEY